MKVQIRKTVKKSAALILALLLAALPAGCAAVSRTTGDDSPESVYAEDKNADFFVYEDTVYMNAQDLEWVRAMQLTAGEQAGEIKRTGVTEEFQDRDATVLDQGTLIYESDSSEVLLAEDGDELIPYLKYVEG